MYPSIKKIIFIHFDEEKSEYPKETLLELSLDQLKLDRHANARIFPTFAESAPEPVTGRLNVQPPAPTL